MRWSFIVESAGPQRHYRAVLMAKGLNELGEDATVWPASYEADDGTLRGFDPEGKHRDLMPPHVVVTRFMTAPSVAELFLRARRAGQIVAVDLDDDLWAFPEWNPKVKDRFNEEATTIDTFAVQANMAAADVVVAATPTLGETVMAVLDTMGEPDVPVAVVRSPVELATPATYHHRPGAAWVGWCGNWAYRGHDLSMIAPTLAKVLPGRGVLRHLGRSRDEPPLPVFLELPPYPISERDWCDITELPRHLAELDLAVVPAEDHRFNRARSATTGLALAAVGVPFVASPLPEYEHLALEGIGMTASTPEEWADELDWLLDDPPMRQDIGAAARYAVGDRHAPAVSAMAWLKVISAL